MIEILVRALGLNPVIPDDVEDIKVEKLFNNRWVSRAVMVVLVIFLVLLYGLLVVLEPYSKRSSLGCLVPAFVAIWFALAIAPSALEVEFVRFQKRNDPPAESRRGEGLSGPGERKTTSKVVVSESIPGDDQHWLVQFCWGLYYSAGSVDL
jgi:hypothetical protein